MRSNFNFNSAPSVESAIDSIASILATYSPTGYTVKREPTVKGKCCKGIISVSVSPKYAEENGCARDLQSTVKYAFYASTTHPKQLGSVAIYAADLGKILSDIRRTRSLFGFRVANVAIEHGRRPFIDVTLAIKG